MGNHPSDLVPRDQTAQTITRRAKCTRSHQGKGDASGSRWGVRRLVTRNSRSVSIATDSLEGEGRGMSRGSKLEGAESNTHRFAMHVSSGIRVV